MIGEYGLTKKEKEMIKECDLTKKRKGDDQRVASGIWPKKKKEMIRMYDLTKEEKEMIRECDLIKEKKKRWSKCMIWLKKRICLASMTC